MRQKKVLSVSDLHNLAIIWRSGLTIEVADLGVSSRNLKIVLFFFTESKTNRTNEVEVYTVFLARLEDRNTVFNDLLKLMFLIS